MSLLNTFLTGVKVLDLSQYIPGPMASLYLADMGAEVLKIEPPNGDEMRQVGPKDDEGFSIFYRALNAGKTVRRLDLKSTAGHAELLALVAKADILIEGFRPGVMARLNLAYETLQAINPRLIYCSLSGFGATGKRGHLAAHDGNFMALSGILDRNGTEGPVNFDPPISDVAGAVFAAFTLAGALQGRTRTGEGCQIDIGLADIPMPLQMLQIAAFGAKGIVPKRGETYLNGGAAYYHLYETADHRHVMLGAMEPKFWTNFARTAGHPEWIARQFEPLPQQALTRDVAAFFAGHTLEVILARFDGADCCLSPVLDLGEALTDADLIARQLVRADDDPDDLQALLPAWVNGVPPNMRPPLRESTPLSHSFSTDFPKTRAL